MLSTNALLEVITTIIQRSDVLECLLEEPRDTRSLVDKLDISRSTVNRSVRDLEQLDLIEYRDGQYHITLSGRLAFHEFWNYVQCLGSIIAAQEVLNNLASDCDIDARAVVEAEVVVPEPAAAYIPGERIEELVRHADRWKGLAYAQSHSGVIDLVHKQIMEEEMTIDVVFRTELWEYAQSAYQEKLDTWRDTGRFQAFTVDSLPFGLQIIETGIKKHVCILAYNQDDQLQGLIVTESEPTVEWAEETYQKYRELATPVIEPRGQIDVSYNRLNE